MYRSAMVSVIVLALSTTFVAADMITGRITKIDERSVTVTEKDGKEGKTYDLAMDCKFYRQSLGSKSEVREGAKATVFKNIPNEGLSATLTTNGQNKVTEIILTGKAGADKLAPTVFQTPTSPRSKNEGEMPAIKLDGEWTILYAEAEGKPMENKNVGKVTIKNNVVTCKMDGKERSWTLHFGPHHMVRCTEQIDGKATEITDKREAGSKDMHTHFGVYIASQDYFSLAMNKGLDKRHMNLPRTGGKEQNPQDGQNGQNRDQPSGGWRFGMDQTPHGSHFVIILHRAGSGSSPGTSK